MLAVSWIATLAAVISSSVGGRRAVGGGRHGGLLSRFPGAGSGVRCFCAAKGRRRKGTGDNRGGLGGQDVFRQEKISAWAQASAARARLLRSLRLRTWSSQEACQVQSGVPAKHSAGLARDDETSRQLRRHRAVTDHTARPGVAAPAAI